MVLAGSLTAGCDRGVPDLAAPWTGELVLERSTRELDHSRARASAVACDAESLITIMAIGSGFSGAIALRARHRGGLAAGEFEVRTSATGLGTAAAAFRPLGDSLGGALVSLGGAVWIEQADPLSGRFQVVVEGTEGRSDTLAGSFGGLVIGADPACARQ
jgi:hypothetical protein